MGGYTPGRRDLDERQFLGDWKCCSGTWCPSAIPAKASVNGVSPIDRPRWTLRAPKVDFRRGLFLCRCGYGVVAGVRDDLQPRFYVPAARAFAFMLVHGQPPPFQAKQGVTAKSSSKGALHWPPGGVFPACSGVAGRSTGLTLPPGEARRRCKCIPVRLRDRCNGCGALEVRRASAQRPGSGTDSGCAAQADVSTTLAALAGHSELDSGVFREALLPRRRLRLDGCSGAGWRRLAGSGTLDVFRSLVRGRSGGGGLSMDGGGRSGRATGALALRGFHLADANCVEPACGGL